MSQKSAKKKRRAILRDPLFKDPPAPKNGAPVEQKVETLEKIYFKVPGPLAQLIVDYIQTKPFQEVHLLISGLQRCEKIKE